MTEYMLEVKQDIPKFTELKEFTLVNSIIELEKMVMKIEKLVADNGFTEIALDLEHHH